MAGVDPGSFRWTRIQEATWGEMAIVPRFLFKVQIMLTWGTTVVKLKMLPRHALILLAISGHCSRLKRIDKLKKE